MCMHCILSGDKGKLSLPVISENWEFICLKLSVKESHFVHTVVSACFQDTFTRAKNWVKELQRQASPNIVIALAGNKADLANKRAVDFQVHTPALPLLCSVRLAILFFLLFPPSPFLFLCRPGLFNWWPQGQIRPLHCKVLACHMRSEQNENIGVLYIYTVYRLLLRALFCHVWPFYREEFEKLAVIDF